MALKAGEGRYGITRKMFLKLKNLSGGAWNYSTNEFNTGQKWIDGKNIYGIVLNNATITVPGGSNFGTIDLTELHIDKPVFCYATNTENGFIYPLVSDSSANQYGVRFTKNDFGLRKPSSGGSITITTMQVTLFYTKM